MLAYLVNLRQLLDLWPMQHPQRECYHLQILAACCGADIPRSCAHIKYNRSLQPWYKKVRAFIDYGFLDSRQPVENDGPGTTSNVVNAGLHDRGAYCRRDNPAEERGGYCSHHMRSGTWRGSRMRWCGSARKCVKLSSIGRGQCVCGEEGTRLVAVAPLSSYRNIVNKIVIYSSLYAIFNDCSEGKFRFFSLCLAARGFSHWRWLKRPCLKYHTEDAFED